MRIRLARSAAEMNALRPAWERLHGAAEFATLFQSFAWNRLAAECFACRERPHVVFAENDSGAAIIPAAISHAGLVLLGEALFDYRDVLSAGDEAPLRAAWAELAQLHLPVQVTALRAVSARRTWRGFAPSPWVTAPQVTRRDTDADVFGASHRGLARALRRLARQGVQLRRRCGSASALVRWIYREKAAQFAGTADNLFADDARVDFMTAVAAMDPAACEIFTLEAGSTVVAALVTFRDRGDWFGTVPHRGDVRRFYTVYFDRTWARYSPGTALCFAITQQSLADGLDCDYMTGEQPLKTRLMTSSVPLFRVNATAGTVARVARVQVPAAPVAA